MLMFNGIVPSNDRLKMITDAVRESGQVTVAELAARTGASDMTIRRDLEVLAEQGMVERYRGGARSVMLRGDEPPYALRAQESLDVKRRIAAEVADLIADGEAVLIDSGTTCLEVARAIAQRRLTVMTLSLHAANALTGAPRLKLLIPGGEPRSGELALTGPLTEASLASLRFDTVVIGCCGLNAANGLTAYDLSDAAIKRAAIASAHRIIAVADAAKFARTGLAFVAAASALDAVVTDDAAPVDETDALAAAGVTVRRV
jgi:DeoR/GlpR family transcriptional regulator of sugar metabolism